MLFFSSCIKNIFLISLIFPQGIWKALKGNGELIDVEMFSYDGECVFVWLKTLGCLNAFFVIKFCNLFLCLEGLTALHLAVLSHNNVVKDLRNLENPCTFMTAELGQQKRLYFECIKILLNMGASCGTKVSITTSGEHLAGLVLLHTKLLGFSRLLWFGLRYSDLNFQSGFHLVYF